MNEAIKILNTCSPIEQDLYISRLSEELQIDRTSIKAQLHTYKERYTKRNRGREYKQIIDNQNKQIRQQTMSSDESIKKYRAEERIISLLLVHPDCYKQCSNFDSNMLSNGFISNVYSIIMDNIEKGNELNLTCFSGSLTDDELGRLSGIIARAIKSNNSEIEFSDCLKTIEEEYKKKNKLDISQLNDEAFRGIFGGN